MIDDTLTVERFDEALKVKVGATAIAVTPDGYKVYEGTATFGDIISPYMDPPRLEWRPADEVLSDAALASMVGCPVSGGYPDDLGNLDGNHPDRLLDPTTAQHFAAGSVTSATRDDSGEVPAMRIRLTAWTEPLQRLIESGVVELSPGYRCREDKTPGKHDGKPYHQVQRDVRYNHLQVVRLARARTPSGIAARLDASASPAPEQRAGPAYPQGVHVQPPTTAPRPIMKTKPASQYPTLGDFLLAVVTTHRADAALSEEGMALVKQMPEADAKLVLAAIEASAPMATEEGAPLAGDAPPPGDAPLTAALVEQMIADAFAKGAPKMDSKTTTTTTPTAAPPLDMAEVHAVAKRVATEVSTAAQTRNDAAASFVSSVRMDGHTSAVNLTTAAGAAIGVIRAHLPMLAARAEADLAAGRLVDVETAYKQAESHRRDSLVDATGSLISNLYADDNGVAQPTSFRRARAPSIGSQQ